MAPFKSYKKASASLNAYRRGAVAAAGKSARSASVAARRAVVPGLTRTGGSYGRYGNRARSMGFLPEKKYFDTALSFTFDSTGEVPATGQLTLIPQGDTESTRDGRKATIESIQIRAQLIFTPGAAASAAAADETHLYVVLDTQANGAAAAATDVFTGTNFATAMLNLNNSGRFRILKHFVHSWNVQAGVTTAYANLSKQIEFYKKCNIDVDWSSTTGAITEIRSNNIFLMAGSGLGTDDTISCNGTARLRFRG